MTERTDNSPRRSSWPISAVMVAKVVSAVGSRWARRGQPTSPRFLTMPGRSMDEIERAVRARMAQVLRRESVRSIVMELFLIDSVDRPKAEAVYDEATRQLEQGTRT